jgi:hypothetical protein
MAISRCRTSRHEDAGLPVSTDDARAGFGTTLLDMPSAPVLLVILGSGLLIMFVFAFTIIGIFGEAIAVIALLALVGRGVVSVVRAVRRRSFRSSRVRRMNGLLRQRPSRLRWSPGHR